MLANLAFIVDFKPYQSRYLGDPLFPSLPSFSRPNRIEMCYKPGESASGWMPGGYSVAVVGWGIASSDQSYSVWGVFRNVIPL